MKLNICKKIIILIIRYWNKNYKNYGRRKEWVDYFLAEPRIKG